MVCLCHMPHALVSSSIFKTGGSSIASLLFGSLFHYLSHRLFLHVLASAECIAQKMKTSLYLHFSFVIHLLPYCKSHTLL